MFPFLKKNDDNKIKAGKPIITDPEKCDLCMECLGDCDCLEVRGNEKMFIFRVETVSGIRPEYIIANASELLKKKAEAFKKEVKKFVEERNWLKYHTPKNLIQAINCEAGELSQLLLFKDYKKEDIWKNKLLLSSISDEIADVFIYLISLINALDLDLSQIFIKKMKKNKTKYSSKEFNNGIYYKK